MSIVLVSQKQQPGKSFRPEHNKKITLWQKSGFVAEAGAHGFSLDCPGSTHFSITVVLVEEENRREVEEGFRRLREQHFPEGKFSKGDEHEIVQQMQFLKELNKLDFSFHALLMDKRKLY